MCLWQDSPVQWLHPPAPEGCGSYSATLYGSFLDGLTSGKSIFVGLGFNLGAVDILYVKTDETLCRQDKNQLREDVVNFLLYTVTEMVDGYEILMLVTGKPDIMNVTKKKLLYFTAGIDIIHVSVNNYLEHHFRMISGAARFFIKLLEFIKIEIINNCIDYADRIVRSYVFINFCEKRTVWLGM